MPEDVDMKPTSPLLFISHKHVNGRIAKVLENFVTTRSAGSVQVYLSSDPESKSPRIGKGLNAELKNALWKAGAVILIYTSSQLDWSYCMIECGIAIDPRSADTKVYVLQCGNDAPAPFAETVRVRATNYKDIEKLARAFLTDRDFFPGHDMKITNFSPNSSQVKTAAQELFTKLQEVLPKDGPIETWTAWPSVRLEIDSDIMTQLAELEVIERRHLVLENSIITQAHSGFASLFGLGDLTVPVSLGQLTKIWENEYPDLSLEWLDVMTTQMVNGNRRQIRDIDWALFRRVDGDRQYLPTLSNIISSNGESQIKFDFIFQNHSKATPVEARMTRINKIQRENLDKNPAKSVNLEALLKKYEDNNWSRIPIMVEEDVPRFIIHTSMINLFVRRQAFCGQDVGKLTLEDLLSEPEMKKMFETTFAVVSRCASIADAKRAMTAIPGCQDVFVTENGAKEQTVLGWLTDRDISFSA